MDEKWYEDFINDITKETEEFFLTIRISPNVISPIVYKVVNGEIVHSNLLNEKVFEKYIKYWDTIKDYGLHIYRYVDKAFVEHKLIPYFNVELFDKDLCQLSLYQEYGLYPADEEDKEELKKSIKAEKIKDTLVYACYSNDMEKIMNYLEDANTSQLNKKLKCAGTPLGLCAKNNNLDAFVALVEKGADLNKVSLGERPLKIAFRHSPDIARYIYQNHREQFEKEVKKEGFSIALHTTDISLLEILRDMGCDMECNKKRFPPLLNFIDYNNVVGIQFLYDSGINMNIVNSYGQTAIERAMRSGNAEALALIEKLTK